VDEDGRPSSRSRAARVLQTIANDLAPGLIDRRGIGPVTAAQAIVSFSRPGRCRNDAAFVALSGTSPLQASSGRTVRPTVGAAQSGSDQISPIAAARSCEPGAVGRNLGHRVLAVRALNL
jgi:Transposase IS116/IS110/IS902 family